MNNKALFFIAAISTLLIISAIVHSIIFNWLIWLELAYIAIIGSIIIFIFFLWVLVTIHDAGTKKRYEKSTEEDRPIF